MSRFVIKIESFNSQPNQYLDFIVEDIVKLRTVGNEILVVTSDASFVGKNQNNFHNEFEVDDHRYGVWRDRSQLREKICSVIGQPLLIRRFVELFGNLNQLIAQILLTRADLADQTRYESIRVMTLNLLKLGIIPIFSENDVLLAGKIGIGDSDQLACMLATAFQADKLIILSNVDGIFEKSSAGNLQLVHEVTNLDGIYNITSSPDKLNEQGTARSRLEAARLVTSFGIEMHMMNGIRERILSDYFINGIPHGTRFPARGLKLKQRKGWIALAALSKGEIIVSTFLAEAIKTRKPASILVIGVEKVIGNFSKNEVVTVKDIDGSVLGRGEVRYSSEELMQLVQKRIDGERMEFYGSEVIHCDYFVRSP